MTYFTYFNGPGLLSENSHFSPNQLGKPANDGLNVLNQFSIRFKFSQNLAFDLQNRFYLMLNNATNNPNFSHLRWEAPRIGVSGKMISGKDWSLTGAINTDFPYFLPAPFSGYQAQKRTVIFNPGTFASFCYEPKNSRWSVFSVVNPRYFFYADRLAAEPQFYNSGSSPGNKPELILSFQPTVTYRFSAHANLTLGTTIDYRKYVISSWNIFNASLISNGSSSAWRLCAVPIILGVTYNISPAVRIFPFLGTYPIAIQRVDARTGNQATLLQASAFGMWLSGTLF